MGTVGHAVQGLHRNGHGAVGADIGRVAVAGFCERHLLAFDIGRDSLQGQQRLHGELQGSRLIILGIRVTDLNVRCSNHQEEDNAVEQNIGEQKAEKKGKHPISGLLGSHRSAVGIVTYALPLIGSRISICHL